MNEMINVTCPNCGCEIHIESVQPNLQPTCNQLATDCISRQAAIDVLRTMQTYKLSANDEMLLIDQAGAQTELMWLPPAQPERKTGKWIWCGDKHVCSECDEFALCDAYDVLDTGEYQEKLTDFCPDCGADMREGQDG